MKRFYVESTNFNEEIIEINGIEHNHLKNVLRMNVGDDIIIVCGDEFDYYCKIIEVNKNFSHCKILNKKINNNNPNKKITFFQALTKKDNMNLIVQKLTELGISTFVPFENQFITAKTSENKQDKLQAISYQSIKQCGRSMPMKVEKTISFKELLKRIELFDMVVFANEKENNYNISDIDFNQNLNNVAIIVGSEGGFSNDEISSIVSNKNVISVSLGKRILRAETASISISAFVSFLLKN